MICYGFNGFSQESKKHDAPSRTNEIIKHDTQPEFNSEIDASITSNDELLTNDYNQKIQEFRNSNIPWKLSSFIISKNDLSENKNNYQLLIDDVKDEFNSNIFYYENEAKALLCRNDNPITPMYFGDFTNSGNDIVLAHKVDGCPTCSKTINYSRSIIKNTLVLKIQDEDDDKSDVFYVLTFIK